VNMVVVACDLKGKRVPLIHLKSKFCTFKTLEMI